MSPDEVSDLDPRLREHIEAERRKGFFKGFNVALVCFVAPYLLWVAYCTLSQVPRFREVVVSVKVPISSLTLFLLDYYLVGAAILFVAALGCVYATRTLGHRRLTLALNIGCLLFSMLWLGVMTTAISQPLLTLLKGIGGR